jgi:hypothetical protein
MRIIAVIVVIELIFVSLWTKISGSGESRKQEKIDSLMMINKSLMRNLIKANDDIQMANEIIEDPSLVLRMNGVAVQVFRADSSHKKEVNLKNGITRNK